MNEQRTVDIRFILGVFFKYCWLIIASAIIAGAVGYCLSKYVMKKRYSSKAIVCVMPNTIVKKTQTISSFPGESQNEMGATYNDFMVINQLINDINVMVSSRNLRNQMLEQLAIEKYYGSASERGDGEFEITDEMLKDVSAELRAAGVSISSSLIRQTRMVEIGASALNPTTATMAANIMAEILKDYLSETYAMNQVNIMDVAIDATAPYSPRPFINTFIGLLLGGGICYALLFLKEAFRGTVDSPDMVTDLLTVPVIGTITQLSEEVSSSRQSASRENNIVTVDIDGKKPRFDVAESFRLLRTNLQYSIGRKDSAKVFVMTSTSPKDGKTFIASNVATIIASSGQKVLLINCDLRKPALHKVFNLKNNRGIVNILVGESTFEEVINRNVLGLSLDILASGPVPPNPSELLMGSAFEQFLDSKRNDYDYIILDAPPCMNISDATIIGKLSDGILYVISAGQTRIDNATHAINQLRSLDIPVVGVILNRFAPKAWSSYGGYGYGYGYKYYGYNDYSEYSKPDIDTPEESEKK